MSEKVKRKNRKERRNKYDVKKKTESQGRK